MVKESKSQPWGAPPAEVALGEAEVHVWQAKLNALLAQKGLGVLSRSERREMKRREVPKHFAAGRYMLRSLLGRYLGEDPARLKLRVDDAGNVTVRGTDVRCFDFAPGQSRALFAISAGQPLALGADFVPEDLDVRDREAEMPPRQARLAEFLSPESRARAFVDHNAEMRAVRRLASRLGLASADTHDFRVERLRLGDNYVAALAVEGWDWSPSFWSFG